MHSIGVPDNSIYIGKLRTIIGEVKHGKKSFETGQAQLLAALLRQKNSDIFPIGKQIFMCRTC